MSIGWLQRSGIKKTEGRASGWHDTVSSLPADSEVRNDKATPVVGDERGIPSVNRGAFRSRALPLSMTALVLAAVGVVWLIPGPKTIAPAARDDPRSSRNERFDENRSAAVLTPNVPPAPPASAPAYFAPDPPAPLATPAPPIRIIPAPDPKAAPALAAAASARQPTPLELRQQSKALIVGSDEKPVPIAPAASAVPLLQPPRPLRPVGVDGEGAGTPAAPTAGAPAVRDAFGDSLRSTPLAGTAAVRLADRTLMLTQGTLLDCALDVAMSSSLPGMTKCTLTRSVFGDDRKVVLLERGSELTGQYQGGMQQGQKRLFVVWVRAKTPAGVVIQLASPGTDSLGRSGVDGVVDSHFWERFGAGLLLSVIDDTFQIASSRAQNGNGGTTVVLPQNTTQTTKNAAAIAVESDVHIPPTLEKNQGDHVSVFVARDLDFRGVYALQRAEPRD